MLDQPKKGIKLFCLHEKLPPNMVIIGKVRLYLFFISSEVFYLLHGSNSVTSRLSSLRLYFSSLHVCSPLSLKVQHWVSERCVFDDFDCSHIPRAKERWWCGENIDMCARGLWVMILILFYYLLRRSLLVSFVLIHQQPFLFSQHILSPFNIRFFIVPVLYLR